MVVPRFVRWALTNEPVLIYGTGRQRRCFCYVQDLVEAVIGLMNCEEAAGKAFNIGSAEELTIETLADRVIEMTASTSAKEFVPYEVAYGRPMDDMMRPAPSLERIKKTVGWEPKTSLDEMLQIVVDSEKAKLKT